MGEEALYIDKSTHVGIYGIAEKDNSILLIKKAEGPYKNLLCLPGGGIEFGETPDETLIREMYEETGLKVISSKIQTGVSFCFKHNVTKDGKIKLLHHICFLYKVECDFTQAIKTCPDGFDSNGAVWVHKNNCDLNLLSPLSKEAVHLLWGL